MWEIKTFGQQDSPPSETLPVRLSDNAPLPGTMLPSEGFPYVFECDCGAEVQVSYSDAAEIARKDWVVRKAVNRVLVEEHGWGETKAGKRCEECLTVPNKEGRHLRT